MELVTNLRDNCPVNKQNKTGELVRTLRLALGLSQEKLAERSGGELDASYVGKIERGSNKASTLKVRRALAAAFGITADILEGYLSETISIDAVVHIATRTDVRDTTLHQTSTSAEKALFEAAKELHIDLEDFEAARAALRDTSFLLSGDMLEFARDWLIAAQQLRKDGHPVNAGTIGVRAALNAANRLSREVKEIREEVGATSGIRPAFDDEGQPVTQAKSK